MTCFLFHFPNLLTGMPFNNLFDNDDCLISVCYQKIYVIHWVQLEQYDSTEEAFDDGMNRLETLLSRVHDIDT